MDQQWDLYIGDGYEMALWRRLRRAAQHHGHTLTEREAEDAVVSMLEAPDDPLCGPRICIFSRTGGRCPALALRRCPWPGCDIPF